MAVSLNEHYRRRFGCKVYKLSLDGGFTCPNRDGTLDIRGCIFCSAYGGGEFAQGQCESVASQLEKAKSRVAAKNTGGKYIAYFQSFTGTYAPVARLRQLYLEAIAPEDIVGLAIGTRPDCLSRQVLDLLGEVNCIKPVSVELGLQTIHAETARYIRRGYDTQVYFDAVKKLKDAGLEVVTHIIIGLPGETPEMMLESVRHVCGSPVFGIKLHLMNVIKTSPLYEAMPGYVPFDSIDEYVDLVIRCLEIIPPEVTIHRLTGDVPRRLLVSPEWSYRKRTILNAINRELALRDTRQGAAL